MTDKERIDFDRAFGKLEAKVDIILDTLPTFMTKEMCQQLHGSNKERVEHLEKAERVTLKGWAQLRGMVIPVALCLTIIGLIVSVFLR
jgi:hypothetical protein